MAPAEHVGERQQTEFFCLKFKLHARLQHARQKDIFVNVIQTLSQKKFRISDPA